MYTYILNEKLTTNRVLPKTKGKNKNLLDHTLESKSSSKSVEDKPHRENASS